METKILFSLLFLASLTGSYGLSLNIPVPDGLKEAIAPHATECKAEYGAIFERTLCPLIATLFEGLAGQDDLIIPEIFIKDLTTISPSLKGFLHLTNVNVAGINKITLGACSMTTPTAESPLVVGLNNIAIPDLKLTGQYDLNITLASMIPLYGAGDLGLALGATISVGTDIALCPYENPLTMTLFDYALTMDKPLDLNMTGLLDGSDFVQDLIAKLEEPNSFASLERLIHPALCGALPGIVNQILLNFTGCTFLGC